MLKYNQFIKLFENEQFSESELKLEILNEGGGYGHLLHPYEDMSLTFFDLQQMINEFISGQFKESNFISIKTDGQNLLFTFIDGEIRFARNNTEVRNFGKTSMTLPQLIQKFDGRGDIQVAYQSAGEDLQDSISKLKPKDIENLFLNGKKFISVEVIYPKTENVIPYGQSLLVFHSTLEYDEIGNVVKEDSTEGKLLGQLIKDANLEVQKTFYIRGPEEIKVKGLNNTDKASYYNSKINNILKNYSLTIKSTVRDFLMSAWQIWLKSQISTKDFLYPIIAQRLVGNKSSYSLNDIKKEDPNLWEWLKEFEKKSLLKTSKGIRMPLEEIFLELGTDILQNISSALLVSPTEANEILRKKIDKAIDVINSSGTDLEKEKLRQELNRINIGGGLDKLNAIEGITFKYKGTTYKWTGLFAAINQVLGLLQFKK